MQEFLHARAPFFNNISSNSKRLPQDNVPEQQKVKPTKGLSPVPAVVVVVLERLAGLDAAAEEAARLVDVEEEAAGASAPASTLA